MNHNVTRKKDLVRAIRSDPSLWPWRGSCQQCAAKAADTTKAQFATKPLV